MDAKSVIDCDRGSQHRREDVRCAKSASQTLAHHNVAADLEGCETV